MASAGVGALTSAMLLSSYDASAAAGVSATSGWPTTTGAPTPDPGHELTLSMPDGATARVDRVTGVATITSKRGVVTYKFLPEAAMRVADGSTAALSVDRAALTADLMQRSDQHYAPDHVVVVFSAGSTPAADVFMAPRQSIAAAQSGARPPTYTSNSGLNAALAYLNVTAERRLFASMSRPRLAELTATVDTSSTAPLAALGRAYVLTLADENAIAAVETLRRQPGVELAALDWYVKAPGTQSTPLSAAAQAAATRQAATIQEHRPADAATGRGDSSQSHKASPADLPTNWGLTSSAQSYWNSPALDAAVAYAEIVDRAGALPGTGQRITDVSIGDLSDDNPASRCYGAGFGPTTIVQKGQRYIDLPSMPLVPTFTASSAGRLDPLGEVCGPDPLLRAIGHELSVMAPLPHDQQRSGHEGDGLTDLLGLAPGATYRVVVPASSHPTVSDVASALLASAVQTPRPTVITTGLVASGDGAGFPERYLEQDPLAQSVITTIVDGLGIPVVAAAGDGVRPNSSIAAIGPTGGGVATNVASRAAQTVLDDVAWSTVPSRLHRSGAIVVGASTTDDIFAKPPHYSADPSAQEQLPFAATRWTGATDYASGYGDRVDVSAPGDAILSMSHAADGSAEDPQPNLAEGTGVAAAQVAAAVADLAQVAQSTGQPFRSPQQLQAFLRSTATPLALVPQADPRLDLGGQVDLRQGVERLLVRAGDAVAPDVTRIAIAQRRAVANLDAVFETGTDPGHIDLLGPRSPYDGKLTGANSRAWITIAPDWQGVDDTAEFALTNLDTGEVLATSRSARLLPRQILASAGGGGATSATAGSTDVHLQYTAHVDGKEVSSQFTLSFGRMPTTSAEVLAPKVAPVVRGDTVRVRYDLRHARGLQAPVALLVSYPGRVNPATGAMYAPLVSRELPFRPGDPSTRVGTVSVPVSELQGAGIYGIGLHLADQDVDGMVTPVYSDFAYTRVAGPSDAAPDAPLVGRPGRALGHTATVPLGSKVRIGWDVSNVPGADGAIIEVSAPGPASAVGVNMFNNPEGRERDANGVDSGSIRFFPVSGLTGSSTRSPGRLGLVPTMTHSIRVLATSDGAVVGIASPVSSVTRAGVELAGKGAVNETGFGIGPGSRDGYAATRGFSNRLGVTATVQRFQLTPPASGPVLDRSRGGNTTYAMVGNGLFGPAGTGLNRTYDFGSGDTLGYASITDGEHHPWTPPRPARLVVQTGGADPSSARGAFVAYDTSGGGQASYDVFTSNVAANTFGPTLDLSGALSAANPARALQVVYDDAARRGVASFASNDFCGTPELVQFDTAGQSATLVPGLGYGDPFSMAVDRAGGVVAAANSCSADMGLYDMDTGDASLVTLDQNGYYVAIDDQHGLVLVGKAVPPNFVNDHTGQSSIAVYRLDGTYVKEIRGVYYWDIGLAPGVDDLQLDPSTRTLWTFGPGGTALEPLHY